MVQEDPRDTCVDSQPKQSTHRYIWSFHHHQQWNTCSSQPKKPDYLVFEFIQGCSDSSCSALDSGNLILIDVNDTSSSESYLWKSFDYPFTTWLLGMMIGKDTSNGLDRFLTSCSDSDIASPGDFTYRFDYWGLPQIILRRGSTRKYRTGLWNGVRFSGLPIPVNQYFVSVFGLNKELLGRIYNSTNKFHNTRITLSQSGILQGLLLKKGSSEWTIMNAMPNDLCDNYGQCGSNSVCKSYKASICECLEGFISKSTEEWKQLIWSGGCVRRTVPDCQRKNGFMTLAQVKLPDLLEFWLNKSMSTKECEAECLKNCSCTAYENSDITGKGNGCLIWFGDLIDIRGYSEENDNSGYSEENPGQDIYIRLYISELSKCTHLLYYTPFSLHFSHKGDRV